MFNAFFFCLTLTEVDIEEVEMKVEEEQSQVCGSLKFRN